MKKLLVLLICVIAVFAFSSCDGSKKTGEDETGTVHFESDDAAFEAMKEAAARGNFHDALRFYDSGAAAVADTEVQNWYYYAKAADDYQKKGCIGHSLDLLQNSINTDFGQSDELMGELQMAVRDLNGCYKNGDDYLYFADGKIAVGEIYELTDRAAATGEIVIKDSVYYWAEHNSAGDDKLLYTFTVMENGYIEVTALEGVEPTYAGIYAYNPTEMPILYY